MRKIYILLVFILSSTSILYSLEPVRVAFVYPAGTSTEVKVELFDYSSNTLVYNTNLGILTANNSGIITFIVDGGTPDWGTISATNINTSLVVNVKIGVGEVLYAQYRLDNLLIIQAQTGSGSALVNGLGAFKSENGKTISISPTDDFIFGSDSTNYGSSEERKFFFDYGKRAFRVGGIANTNWDLDSIGLYSFSSGLNTKAKGWGSVAFGNDTESMGFSSFVANYNNQAIGSYSVAFGVGTNAIGNSSFTVGGEATATGEYSSALGYRTHSKSNYSFAAGYLDTAEGNGSIAMGYLARAKNTASVSIGNGSIATGFASTALGTLTQSIGNYSTALGNTTKSEGSSSTALGFRSMSNGDYSIAGGNNDTANGYASIALGSESLAGSDYSVAIGNNAKSTGFISLATNHNTNSSGDYSVAMGNGTVASGEASTALGYGTKAASSYSTSVGKFNIDSGNQLFAVGNGTDDGNRSNALEVNSDGNTIIGKALVLSFGSGLGTISNNITVWNATGDVTVPNLGVNGQILYIINTSGGDITVTDVYGGSEPGFNNANLRCYTFVSGYGWFELP